MMARSWILLVMLVALAGGTDAYGDNLEGAPSLVDVYHGCDVQRAPGGSPARRGPR